MYDILPNNESANTPEDQIVTHLDGLLNSAIGEGHYVTDMLATDDGLTLFRESALVAPSITQDKRQVAHDAYIIIRTQNDTGLGAHYVVQPALLAIDRNDTPFATALSVHTLSGEKPRIAAYDMVIRAGDKRNPFGTIASMPMQSERVLHAVRELKVIPRSIAMPSHTEQSKRRSKTLLRLLVEK